MRSSLVVRASDCQCTSCNGPGFDPSIRLHSGIWGAADEAVLNIVRTKRIGRFEICGPNIFCDCWLSPRICGFKKQLLGHLCKFTQKLGGNSFMKKTLSRKSRGTAPLNFLLHVQNCTKWKPQIQAVIPCQLETSLYPMTESTLVPPHTHTHKWRIIFWEQRGVDFTCNTAEMFSFGPNPTRAKKTWSSSTCLLYAEDPPKQFKREYIWEFFRKFRVVSVCYETDLFVSVVRFETPKQTAFFSFCFHETNRNKRETDLVSVCFGSNRNYFCLFRGHPTNRLIIYILWEYWILGPTAETPATHEFSQQWNKSLKLGKLHVKYR